MSSPPALLGAFHHVGVITPDAAEAARVLRALGYTTSVTFEDPVQKAAIVLCTRAGGRDGQREPMIELIAPLDPSSPAAGWLKRLRAGAYHVCYETADLEATVEGLVHLEFAQLSKPAPAVAFEGRRVVFLWSAAAGLVELVEGTSRET